MYRKLTILCLIGGFFFCCTRQPNSEEQKEAEEVSQEWKSNERKLEAEVGHEQASSGSLERMDASEPGVDAFADVLLPDQRTERGKETSRKVEPEVESQREAWSKKPGCRVAAVKQKPNPNSWVDSYSANGKCYCNSTFDHGIGRKKIQTPAGLKTVKEICDKIGPGPGRGNHPIYNDIQCGNGPDNGMDDEKYCPGRVDQGKSGCCWIGPKWDLSVFK